MLTSIFLVLGVRVLVDAREKLHIPWGKPSNQQHGDTMMAFDTRSAMAQGHGMVEHKVFQHYLPSIRALWADEGIQNAYDRRREFQLVSYTVCKHLHQEKYISVYETRQNVRLAFLLQVLNARFSKGRAAFALHSHDDVHLEKPMHFL